MDKFENTRVAEVFENYPASMRKKLMFLRQLVLDTAGESDDVVQFEETLKWGEPSYISKQGSTLRLGWKSSTPDQYAMFFHCRTMLVDTFKALYADKFRFEGNRAMIFHEKDKIHVTELKHCILLTLTYHKQKRLLAKMIVSTP